MAPYRNQRVNSSCLYFCFVVSKKENVSGSCGRWGIPSGPYLVLPIFGPSSPRDTVGLVGDLVLSAGPSMVSPGLGAALTATDLINWRAAVLDDIREARAAALDYYVLVRNGYVQRRRAQVRNEDIAPEEAEEDLYEIVNDE